MASKINKNKAIAAAQKYIQKNALDKAIKEYRRIVEEDPRDVRIWLKIGDLYARKGSDSDAIDTYAKVAEFYSEQGFYLKAVAVYKQILRISPRLVDVNLRLAEMYKQLGLLNDAMKQYEQVSNFYAQDGRTREALDALRQIINLDPTNVISRIKLAELYSKEGMQSQAVEEFAKAADYLRATGRMDDFIKVAERLVFHQSDNVAVIKELARLYLDRKEAARSLQKLQLAFKFDPRDIDTLDMLADAFHMLNQQVKTISVLKELARIFEEMGERDKRKEVFQRILRMDPSDPDAKAALSLSRPVSPSPAPRSSSTLSVPPPPIPKVLPLSPPADSGASPMPSNPWVPPASSATGPEAVQARAKLDISDLVLPPLREDGVLFDSTASRGLTFPSDPLEPSDRDLLHGFDEPRGEPEVKPLNPLPRAATGPLLAVSVKDPSPLPEAAPALPRPRPRDHAPPIQREVSASSVSTALVQKLIAEADVYLKYGLQDKAIEHLEQVFTQDPYNVEVRLKLKEIYVHMRQLPRAAHELLILAEHLVNVERRMAADLLNEALNLDPDHAQARWLLKQIEVTPIEESLPSQDHWSESHEQEVTPFSSLMFDASHIDSVDLEAEFGMDSMEMVDLEAGVPVENAGTEAADPWETDTGQWAAVGAPSSVETFDEGPTRERPDAGRPDEVVIKTGTEYPAVNGADDLAPEPVLMSDRLRPTTREAGGIEDDLEEAEFFIQQSLFSEARAILSDLKRRYPGNQLIGAKLAEMELAEEENRSQVRRRPSASDEAIPKPVLADGPAAPASIPVVAQALPEPKERLRVEDVFNDLSRDPGPQDSDEDSDTHYDLGIAYREMGLMDDAIKEFSIALRSPEKKALCHTMIGLCHMDKKAYGEAIDQFRMGLGTEGIKPQEIISLLYELGVAHEKRGEVKDARHIFQKVASKVPRFRDVNARLERLQTLDEPGSASGSGQGKLSS